MDDNNEMYLFFQIPARFGNRLLTIINDELDYLKDVEDGATDDIVGQLEEFANDIQYSLGKASATALFTWLEQWRKLGDDMQCPACFQYQLKSMYGVTACYSCGWSAPNPVMLETYTGEDK